MIRRLPYLARLGLVIALLAASVATGAVRGQAQAAGTAILCLGEVARAVPVDAEGRPTSGHHCPLCTLAPHATLPQVASAPARPAVTESRSLPPALPPASALAALPPRSRGPPRAV
ncbi:DUF2946 family protein [Pseudoruegeria aquimaris]|uniref:DUF2946 family protein n=1 Tax=Pseudoruegeria aquimaris TaxID=393663 RepID=UPI000A26CEAF